MREWSWETSAGQTCPPSIAQTDDVTGEGTEHAIRAKRGGCVIELSPLASKLWVAISLERHRDCIANFMTTTTPTFLASKRFMSRRYIKKRSILTRYILRERTYVTFYTCLRPIVNSCCGRQVRRSFNLEAGDQRERTFQEEWIMIKEP